MAYYSGTAGSLTALKTALLTHAQTDGWVLTGDVLSKAGVFFQIQETATNITCLGCESNAAANPAPNVVSIGRIYEDTGGAATREITFPCSYEVFGFAQECYLVVNYDVGSYQWMAFGKSTVPGLPGQGGWVGSTIGVFGVSSIFSSAPIIISKESGGASGSVALKTTSGALFWGLDNSEATARNCWVNHGLDTHGWTYNGLASDVVLGIRPTAPLISMQPGVWNSESVLLPIRALKERPSFKSSLIADLTYARHVRIDNLSPGDIITIGSDKWKIFPWYQKYASARDGGGGGGGGINHTGTFGWAIRYEGP